MDIDIEDLLNRIIILECELEDMKKKYHQAKSIAEMAKELAIQSGKLYEEQKRILIEIQSLKKKTETTDHVKIKEMMEKFAQTQRTVSGIVDVINKMETRRWQ